MSSLGGVVNKQTGRPVYPTDQQLRASAPAGFRTSEQTETVHSCTKGAAAPHLLRFPLPRPFAGHDRHARGCPFPEDPKFHRRIGGEERREFTNKENPTRWEAKTIQRSMTVQHTNIPDHGSGRSVMEALSEALVNLVFGDECKSCPLAAESSRRYASILKRLADECTGGIQRLPDVHGDRILRESINHVAITSEWDHCMSVLDSFEVHR